MHCILWTEATPGTEQQRNAGSFDRYTRCGVAIASLGHSSQSFLSRFVRGCFVLCSTFREIERVHAENDWSPFARSFEPLCPAGIDGRPSMHEAVRRPMRAYIQNLVIKARSRYRGPRRFTTSLKHCHAAWNFSFRRRLPIVVTRCNTVCLLDKPTKSSCRCRGEGKREKLAFIFVALEFKTRTVPRSSVSISPATRSRYAGRKQTDERRENTAIKRMSMSTRERGMVKQEIRCKMAGV